MASEITVDNLNLNLLNDKQYYEIEEPSFTELYVTPSTSITLEDVESTLDLKSKYPVQNKVITHNLESKADMADVEEYTQQALSGIVVPVGKVKVISSEYNINAKHVEDTKDGTVLNIYHPLFYNYVSTISTQSQRPTIKKIGDYVLYNSSTRIDVYLKESEYTIFTWNTYSFDSESYKIVLNGNYDQFKSDSYILYSAYATEACPTTDGNIYIYSPYAPILYDFVYLKENDSMESVYYVYEMNGSEIVKVVKTYVGGYAYQSLSDGRYYYTDVMWGNMSAGTYYTLWDSDRNELDVMAKPTSLPGEGIMNALQDENGVIYNRAPEADDIFMLLDNDYFIKGNPLDTTNPYTFGNNFPSTGEVYETDPEQGEILYPTGSEYTNYTYYQDSMHGDHFSVEYDGTTGSGYYSSYTTSQIIFGGIFSRNKEADITEKRWIPFGNSYLYNKNYAILPDDYNGVSRGDNNYVRMGGDRGAYGTPNMLISILGNDVYQPEQSDSYIFNGPYAYVLTTTGYISQAKACAVASFPDIHDDPSSQMRTATATSSTQRLIFTQNGGVGAGIIFCKIYTTNDEFLETLPIFFIHDKIGVGKVLSLLDNNYIRVWLESCAGMMSDQPEWLSLCFDTVGKGSDVIIKVSAVAIGDFTSRDIRTDTSWHSNNAFSFSVAWPYSSYSTRSRFEEETMIPAPPSTGNYQLHSDNGVLQWEVLQS